LDSAIKEANAQGELPPALLPRSMVTLTDLKKVALP
jgi:hypothetical protein